MRNSQARRGRPPIRDDRPIKVAVPFDELVRDMMNTGPHPKGAGKKQGGPKKTAR